MAADTVLGRAVIPIRATITELDKDLAQAKGKVEGASSGINGALGKIKWAAVGAGATVLTGVLSDLAREGAADAASMEAVRVAVENTGASWDDAEGSISTYIDRMRDTAAVADDQTKPALASLIATTGNYEKSIKLVSLAADLARGKNMSLSGAAELVGKVSQGNVAILKRYGIVLDENATAEEALAELQKRFAGQAETYGKTTQGRLESISARIGDFREDLGKALGPAQLMIAMLPGMSAGFSLAGSAIAAVTGGLVRNTAVLVAHRVATMAATVAQGVMTAAQWMLNVALTANPIGIIIIALAALTAGVIWAYHNVEWFHDICDSFFAFLGNVLSPAVNAARGVIVQMGDAAGHAVGKLAEMLGLTEKLSDASRFAGSGGGGGGADGGAVSPLAKSLKLTTDQAAQAATALGGIGPIVDDLIRTSPAAIEAANAVAGLQDKLEGLQDAQRGSAAASQAMQDAMKATRDQASELSDALNDAKRRLDELTRPRLTGMTALDDKIFSIEQKAKKLQLQLLQLEQRGITKGPQVDALKKQEESLRRQAEILRVQAELKYDPQLRAIERAAKGVPIEMTKEQAIAAIKKTKDEIADYEKRLLQTNKTIAAQEAASESLQKASAGLADSVKAVQDQLGRQEEKQKAVNDALKIAYEWFINDRTKLREMGGEAAKQAGVIDDKTRQLLRDISTYAEEESSKAIESIRKAVQEYELAKAKIAAGLIATTTEPTTPVGTPRWTPRGYALGGPVSGPVGAPQLAIVHGGEYVIPAGQSGSSRSITINGPLIQATMTNEADEDRLAHKVWTLLTSDRDLVLSGGVV